MISMKANFVILLSPLCISENFFFLFMLCEKRIVIFMFWWELALQFEDNAK